MWSTWDGEIVTYLEGKVTIKIRKHPIDYSSDNRRFHFTCQTPKMNTCQTDHKRNFGEVEDQLECETSLQHSPRDSLNVPDHQTRILKSKSVPVVFTHKWRVGVFGDTYA
jgi:hypothetical protein